LSGKRHYFQLRPSALGEATEEWYEQLDPEVKEWVDKMANEMRENVKAKNGDAVQFGIVGARETLCALIAYCERWELKQA
jgi:hypothetical protein